MGVCLKCWTSSGGDCPHLLTEPLAISLRLCRTDYSDQCIYIIKKTSEKIEKFQLVKSSDLPLWCSHRWFSQSAVDKHRHLKCTNLKISVSDTNITNIFQDPVSLYVWSLCAGCQVLIHSTCRTDKNKDENLFSFLNFLPNLITHQFPSTI